ncbi:MAG: hypothetical protein ACOYNI_04830 [Acidimicrobiia bacterium]
MTAPIPPAPAPQHSSWGTWWKVLLAVGVGLLVLVVVGGALLWWWTGAPERRARERIDAVGAPAGFTRDGAANVSGNWACLDACVRVTQSWRVTGLDKAEAERRALEHAREVGARQPSWRVTECSAEWSSWCVARIEIDNDGSAVLVKVYSDLGAVSYAVDASS